LENLNLNFCSGTITVYSFQRQKNASTKQNRDLWG
jgi:hypothetical protein